MTSSRICSFSCCKHGSRIPSSGSSEEVTGNPETLAAASFQAKSFEISRNLSSFSIKGRCHLVDTIDAVLNTSTIRASVASSRATSLNISSRFRAFAAALARLTLAIISCLNWGNNFGLSYPSFCIFIFLIHPRFEFKFGLPLLVLGKFH